MSVRRTIEISGCEARSANINVVPLRSAPAMNTGPLSVDPRAPAGVAPADGLILIGVSLQEVEAGNAPFDVVDPWLSPLHHLAASIGPAADDAAAGPKVVLIHIHSKEPTHGCQALLWTGEER